MLRFLSDIFDCIDSNKWKKLFSKFFIASILLTLYIPLIIFVLLSFNAPSNKGNVPTTMGNWNGIQNYVSFFSNSSFTIGLPEALLNSLIIAAFSVPISLFVGTLTAISIWKNYGRGYKSTIFFCNLSISSPDIIQAISFFILFSVLVIPLGIDFGLITIILSHIALSIPYVIVFIYPSLSKIKHNILYVSQDLNYNFSESILHVLIPTLFPNILASALLVFTISFDDFIITNLVRGNTTTITTELYTMRHGIKAWSVVFGSLIIVGITVFLVLHSLIKSINSRFNKYD